MNFLRYFACFALVLPFCFGKTAKAQDAESKWKVDSTLFDKADTISFTTREGTWMNLDLSPDGKWLVFDLLGDIYVMPSAGGVAKAIRTGPAWEVQPRFSPNGSQIAFTSDLGGGDNIWVCDREGKHARQITKEDFRLLNNPVWSPDGKYIAARKHFTSTRSAGAGEIWLYHTSGGQGVQLTERKNDQQDVNEPFFHPDGSKIWFSEDMYPGGYFQYNKDPNSEIYISRSYDFAQGKVKNEATGPGGAVRPTPSHKGDQLAFVRRVRTQTVLFVQDLVSGKAKAVYADLDKDQQEAWAIFGVYPGFAWSPDDKYIYIWAKGGIQKVDVSSGEAISIPFEAKVQQVVKPALRFKQGKLENRFYAKAIRHMCSHPEGRARIFHAAGKLYIQENGSIDVLGDLPGLQFDPSYSKDGKRLSFVSWQDTAMGSIIVAQKAKKAWEFTRLNLPKGIYRTPRLSPDGSKLLFVKESGNRHLGYAWCYEPGIYLYDFRTETTEKVSEKGENPWWHPSGTKFYYQTGGIVFGSLNKTFEIFDLEKRKSQVLTKSKYAGYYAPSPDGQWLAFTELHKVFLMPMPSYGQSFELSGKAGALPISEVSDDAGIALHWLGNSQTLRWTLGPVVYETELSKQFDWLSQGQSDTLSGQSQVSADTIKLELAADVHQSTFYIRVKRIITMGEQGVLEPGVVVVKGNRILQVGRPEDIPPQKDWELLMMDSSTLMPGLVDVHAHTGNFRHGISPEKQWEYYANLAYGVTTTHDPSANTEMVFAQSEMLRAGRMLGPRLFSTGTILYGADGDFRAPIETYRDAERAIARTKAFGAFSVKSYNQPRRNQRQMVIQAAEKQRVLVMPEGGSHFFHNMSMIVDGHTGIEHNIPVAPLYGDVLNFWSKTQTGNTPTLIVNYGGINGEYYWYQKSKVWEKERLLAFTPRPIIDSRSRHRTIIPEEEYENGHILSSQSCAALQSHGVRMHMGSHGQIQGLGAHWEIWMLAQGGMTPLNALKAATIDGAAYLGLDHELGSLEAGKLADMIFIDGNPLQNIQATEHIDLVMLNGRFYDPSSLIEVFTGKFRPTPFYWQMEDSPVSYPWEEGQDLRQHMCGCGLH